MSRSSLFAKPYRSQTLRGLLLATLLLTLHLSTSAAQEQYEDGTFDVDGNGALVDWSPFGPFLDANNPTGGGYGASAPRSGGNPGAHLQSELTTPSVPLGESWGVWGILINDQAVYDPSTMGAIERIDFDFDARVPVGTFGTRAVSLAIMQDGYLWGVLNRRLITGEQSWSPTSISGLVADDFMQHVWGQGGQPETPDFSETGAPISFGLLQGQSCPVTSDCSLPARTPAIDVDNWTVTVNDTGLSIDLSVNPILPPGELEDLPLQFAVSAIVRNAGEIEVSDVAVRFVLPQEALVEFSIPDECTQEPDTLIINCVVPGPIGAIDTVRVPSGLLSDEPPKQVILTGYAAVVPDGSEFTYEAEIVSFSGRDTEPSDVLMDEVVITVCNPTGMAPGASPEACDDPGTGGTPGTGGVSGSGGTSPPFNPVQGGTPDDNGCGCYVASSGTSSPWFAFLCLAAFAAWRLRRRGAC